MHLDWRLHSVFDSGLRCVFESGLRMMVFILLPRTDWRYTNK